MTTDWNVPGNLTYGKSPCLMGKSTISTGPFSIAICMFTRGYMFGISHRMGYPILTHSLMVERQGSATLGNNLCLRKFCSA